MTSIRHCPWCAARLARTTPSAQRPDWPRARCRGCGTLSYDSLPPADALRALYTNASRCVWPEANLATGATDAHIAKALVDAVCNERPGGAAVLRCLDVGSGKGTVAGELARRGLGEVVALEPYAPDPRLPGVRWVTDWRAIPEPLRFDLVLMVEVIEHLSEPLLTLRAIRERLADGGVLLITTPNARGWRARLQRGRWREAQNPTHLTLFAPTALHRALTLTGFHRVRRLRAPLDYGKTGFGRRLLTLTQRLGLDGSLRVIAQ